MSVVVDSEDSLREQAAGLPRAPSRQSRCVHCNRDLSKQARDKPAPGGRACNPRCRGTRRQLEERAASAERPAKKHHRIKSDPGQPLFIASIRLRIRAPKPPPPKLKPRHLKPSIDHVDPMALLEVAHARRMALLEAEQNGTGSSATNGSAIAWQ